MSANTLSDSGPLLTPVARLAYDGRPQAIEAPSLQHVYDRGRVSLIEFSRHLTTLATTSVGIFFIALSTRLDPPMTAEQRTAVLWALAFMLLVVLSAMSAWLSDSLGYVSWAKLMAGRAPARCRRGRRRAYIFRKIFTFLALFAFVMGAVAAGRYVYLRVGELTQEPARHGHAMQSPAPAETASSPATNVRS